MSSSEIRKISLSDPPQLAGVGGEACAAGGEPEALVVGILLEAAFQGEEDGGAAHVAEVVEDVAGFC